MHEYLVFQLAGHIASWGDIAIGESRPTHRGPTRSAIIGLISSALRVRRDDIEEQAALQRAVGVAILTLAQGSNMRDYHTAQVPSAEALKGRSSVTRRDELMELVRYNRDRGASSGTILSSREYLCEAAWLVAIWLRQYEVYSLEHLLRALVRPGFVPYLGRKSCPVMLPLGARIIKDDCIRDVLIQWWSGRPVPSVFEVLPTKEARAYPIEWDTDGVSGVLERSRTLRRDDPGDRERWQFVNRPVCQGECALEEIV